jgi:hypothetical protein
MAAGPTWSRSASWLANVDWRVDSYALLVVETAAWEKRRSAERARFKWMFTTEKARARMGWTYPSH